MLLRGIQYRPGRSVVVVLLAAVAVAAVVLVPGYSRAAQQSVLTDTLRSAPAAGLTVSVTGTAAGAPLAHAPVEEARSLMAEALAGTPVLARALASPVAGADTDTVVTGATEPLAGRLAYRDGVCDQLVVAGDCPTAAGQVLISARTAEEHRLAPGDVLTAAGEHELTVVGTYRPTAPSAPYWGRTSYFTHGGFDPVSGAPRIDAIFTSDQSDLRAGPDAVANLALTYPLRPDAVRLDDLAGLRGDLRTLAGTVRVAGLEPTTALASILEEVAADQATIADSVPVIAVPLVLLAWVVLFLLVAALIEERRREVALAKLRGFSVSRTAWFALGEVLTLIVAATPVGVALGLGLVAVAARVVLAEGTGVELRWSVGVAAAAALVVSAAAAVLAARITLRRGALDLLRQVPPRRRWRGAAETGAVALAVASLVAALDDRGSLLALLAPALLAVVVGIAAARVVQLRSTLRLRSLRRRGRGITLIPKLLAAAQLARRPAGARVTVVVTVAVALLAFAATAWDVAARARHEHAVDRLGADQVYLVAAEHPAALVTAVEVADPGGDSMAVVRANYQYAGEPLELLAVPTGQLTKIAQWRGLDRAAVATLAKRLRPSGPEPLPVAGEIEVTARVRDPGPVPIQLDALVAAPGAGPRAVSLGVLEPERRHYRARLSGCEAGCRLLGLMLRRTGAAGPVVVTVDISAINSQGPLLARFAEPGAWDGPVTPGRALLVEATGADPGDVMLAYQDTPAALPVVSAGTIPTDSPATTTFRFPGLADQVQSFTVVDRVARLPRVDGRGLLVDLDYAVRQAERSAGLVERPGLRYEVWAGPDAPAELPDQLAAAGTPVLAAESVTATEAQLSRRAPALGWWLYLLAGGVALALALGVVLLSTRIGVETRLQELATLRVSGVRPGLLRRALLREQLTLLGKPLVAGFAVGVAGAVVLLPGLPLVESGAMIRPNYQLGFGALPVAAGAVGLTLLLAVGWVMRLPERASPLRFREDR